MFRPAHYPRGRFLLMVVSLVLLLNGLALLLHMMFQG